MAGRAVFSRPVLDELDTAGWTPGRAVDIAAWVDELSPQGYRLSDIAAKSLRSFGGLELDPINSRGPNFSNDEPLIVDPILAGSGHFALAEELSRELGDEWYPFGERLSSSSIFIGASGYVVATGLGWIWELGRSIEEAIEFALMASHPLHCIRVLTPGAKPWPPEKS